MTNHEGPVELSRAAAPVVEPPPAPKRPAQLLQAAPVVVVRDFFEKPPEGEQLPSWYGDDQVLSFEREPGAIYAAWDFSGETFGRGRASGWVIDEQGAVVQRFGVGRAAGGAFLADLPAGYPVRIEVRRGDRLLGRSGWVALSRPGQSGQVPPSSSAV